jgi:hypothetical protein
MPEVDPDARPPDPTLPKDAPTRSIADLAEQTGRHYRSRHLRRAGAGRTERNWAIAAGVAVGLGLSLLWFLLR